jgi:hypothetical protein
MILNLIDNTMTKLIAGIYDSANTFATPNYTNIITYDLGKLSLILVLFKHTTHR